VSVMERSVEFTCGHRAERRVCRDGRSLVGEKIRCDNCGWDRKVVAESDARPLSIVVADA